MKVLVISHMYPSSANRMSGIFVKKQVEELKNMGCDITVICPIPWAGFPLNILNKKWKCYNEVPYEEVCNNIEVYYPRYREYPRGIAFASSGDRMYKGIKKLVHKLNEKKKFDMIHCHVALPDGQCGMKLSQELKIPFIVTIHGQDFQYTIKKSEELKNKVFQVLNKAETVVVVSNKLKNVIDKESFIRKTHVVFNGVDCVEFNKDGNTFKNIPNDIDILSASNLLETKGLKYNIMAVKELSKKYKNIKYYIIGSGNQEADLRKMVEEYGIEKNVCFTGRLPQEEVLKWMNQCKVFSLPSYEEGFGVVYIEAMMQKKPVIGIRGQGIQDAIKNGENGFLVSPKESEELIKTLGLLLKDETLRNSVGKKAQESVIENFTWKKTAERLIHIYENLNV